MSKSNRMYKIFMTSMIVIIAGLLLATGIIAIQKSMKLKANIEFLPGVNVEIYVNEESENGLLFRNFDKDTNNKIYVNSTYCELGATTLTMNNNFVTAYGNNFTLIVKNYSGFTISTEITSTATAKIGENSVNAVPAEITPPTAQIATGDSEEFVVSSEPIIPQETIISIRFEEFVSKTYYTINYISGGQGAQATGIPDSVQEGSSATITLSSSTSGYSSSVPTVTGSCTSSFDVVTGTLTLTNITSNISITSKGMPWTYGKYSDLPDADKMTSKYFVGGSFQETEFAYNSVWKGYSYIKFANDTNTRWIIIGAGGDIASSVFNKSEIDASIGNSASFALTGTQNGYTYNSKDMLAPAANPNGDLTDSQILLLREVVLDSTQKYDETTKYARWTTADGATKASLNTYLNTTFYNTGLYTYEEYIENPTLKTAWANDSNCIEYIPGEGDNSRIFLMGSRYGYYDSSQTYKTGAVWTSSHQAKYKAQNFCIEDYIGTYVYGVHDSNPRMFYYHSPDTSNTYFACCWLRSGIYNSYALACGIFTLGYILNVDVSENEGGVRPSFILNLA